MADVQDCPRRIVIGERFGSWLVIGDAPIRWVRNSNTEKAVRMVTAVCSCGVQREVILGNLVRGGSRDCGHGRAQRLSEHMRLHWSRFRQQAVASASVL